MKTAATHKSRRNKTASVNQSRWLAYATASAAAAFGGAASKDAVASIHYSGPINEFFDGTYDNLQLDQPGDSIIPAHAGSAAFGAGYFFVYGINAGSMAGFVGNTSYQYVSKLASNINLNGHAAWVPFKGTLAYGIGYTYSQWKEPGTGFVGFRFDGGDGFQYGWARITVEGTPGNRFTLVDFAWADFGDQISTGQVPEPGSLALLALGGAGLLAWRKRRNCHAPTDSTCRPL